MKLENWKGLVYEPGEDSYIILDYIKKYGNNKKVLDMGCGSGILGIQAAMLNSDVTAVDLNPLALRLTKKNAESNNVKIRVIYSDLFEFVPEEKYDLIIFNPPYLPEDPIVKDIDLTGGLYGYETTLKFLELAQHYMAKNSNIILAISSLSQPDIVFEKLKELKYDYNILKEEKFAWEKLIILLICYK